MKTNSEAAHRTEPESYDTIARKPEWLRKRFSSDADTAFTGGVLDALGLNTVCNEALCPNRQECYARRTATFMILGVNCTRDCAFCNVRHGEPTPPDAGEPARIGEAAAKLGLRYAVITSVTRDDLPGGGARQFADTVAAIRLRQPEAAIETLIPDFGGDWNALSIVIEAKPNVLSHNIETVEELYSEVRPGADYRRTLGLIARVSAEGSTEGKNEPAPERIHHGRPMTARQRSTESKNESAPEPPAANGTPATAAASLTVHSKSGLMVGLGETESQVLRLMDDLREANCEFLTIGQYLAPSRKHRPVSEYIEPKKFDYYAEAAKDKGFKFVASAPFVRSSYNAGEALGII